MKGGSVGALYRSQYCHLTLLGYLFHLKGSYYQKETEFVVRLLC